MWWGEVYKSMEGYGLLERGGAARLARGAHNPEVGSSNLPPATILMSPLVGGGLFLGVVLCFVSCFWGVLRVFLGGFGCCFAAVQLLVCMIGPGLAVGFRFVGMGVMRVWLFEWLGLWGLSPRVGGINRPPTAILGRGVLGGRGWSFIIISCCSGLSLNQHLTFSYLISLTELGDVYPRSVDGYF